MNSEAAISSTSLKRTLQAFAPSVVTKTLLKDALRPVSGDLANLSERITGYIPIESRTARDVIAHVFSAGGKRIRPALYFMACNIMGYKGPHLYSIAAVTEFVHTASLLHDDVVDHSTTRRNKPTANSIWGDQASVLVGDLIYSRASEMMAETGNMQIVTTFARAIRLMSEGELLQLENLFNGNMQESTYLRILECKTAVLIAAACKSAALLAGAPESSVQAFETFGRCIGMAFQLIDDALDYKGVGSIVGKPTLADLKEGKVTLPIILLRDVANHDDLAMVQNILAQPTVSDADVKQVSGLVHKYRTTEFTLQRANEYTNLAMDALHQLPPSADRDHLETLAQRLLHRAN